MIYALDTNVIVDLLRGRDPELARRYLSHPPGQYAVSEMVRAELLFGMELSQEPESKRMGIEAFLAPLQLMPFGGDAVSHYAIIRAHLQKRGLPIGPNDLVIAATARANGHTLITRNTSEFSRVPALAWEEW